MEQHWTLQRLIGRDKQIDALEEAANLAIENDK